MIANYQGRPITINCAQCGKEKTHTLRCVVKYCSKKCREKA